MFQSLNKICNAFRFKDRIPYRSWNIIYEYKCNICNDVHIGEIKHCLFVRQCIALSKITKLVLFVFPVLEMPQIITISVYKNHMLLRLHVMQKVLQLPLFSSLCSSLQQIWMDWWKLLVELCKFVKLDEYGLDVKEKRYVTNIYSYLKFCLWKDDMLCAVEKAIMVKVSGHILFFMM